MNFFLTFVTTASTEYFIMENSKKLFSLFCGAALISIAAAISLHEEMTETERLGVFGESDNVGEYEVASIHWPKVHKRSTGTGLKFVAFGKDIQLWLQPTDAILVGYNTPVYKIRKNKGTYSYERDSTLLPAVERWEDKKNSAALTVTRKGNDTMITGHILKDNLVIRPVPVRLAEEVKRKRRSIDGISEEESKEHHYHIISRRQSSPNDVKHISKSLNESVEKRRKRSLTIPDTVYPEILVVVAHDLVKKLGTDIQAISYLVAFWNGVDLLYRNLENPKFRLNIAAIVLAEDPNALDYMNDHKFNESRVFGNDVLAASGYFWYGQRNEIDVHSYDLAITMTSLTLCSPGPDDTDPCSHRSTGWAYTEGICHVDPNRRKVEKVGIFEDTGVYDGIHTAAHELGHIFGAKHDGTVNEDCSKDKMSLMAPAPQFGGKDSDWSECSLKDIQAYIEVEGDCIFNKPVQKHVLPIYLPGKFIDADKQCSVLEGTRVCFRDSPDNCQRLGCILKNKEGYCNMQEVPAAPGTKCGENKICLHQQCVDDPLVNLP